MEHRKLLTYPPLEAERKSLLLGRFSFCTQRQLCDIVEIRDTRPDSSVG